jgi:hypothetical protein
LIFLNSKQTVYDARGRKLPLLIVLPRIYLGEDNFV